jgi:hypothetical protein
MTAVAEQAMRRFRDEIVSALDRTESEDLSFGFVR